MIAVGQADPLPQLHCYYRGNAQWGHFYRVQMGTFSKSRKSRDMPLSEGQTHLNSPSYQLGKICLVQRRHVYK
jgi:hypothetical protein